LASNSGPTFLFSFLGQTAWGEGIGERLTPLELPEAHFAVVFPGVGNPHLRRVSGS
jgi:4-diphosphocytidyl-2C-methyl-D-erythritol kinase